MIGESTIAERLGVEGHQLHSTNAIATVGKVKTEVPRTLCGRVLRGQRSGGMKAAPMEHSHRVHGMKLCGCRRSMARG